MRSKNGHLYINFCSTYMACKCLIYACDVIFHMLKNDLHISKKGNYGIGIIMFYIYIGEVYNFKLGCVVEIG